jgi:hypothetical protein
VCALCALQDSAWASRGFGNLQLRRPGDVSAGGSARLLVRNDTGKLMLNAKLYKGIKVRLQGKSVCTTLFNAVQPAGGAATEGGADDAQKSQPIQTCAPRSLLNPLTLYPVWHTVDSAEGARHAALAGCCASRRMLKQLS